MEITIDRPVEELSQEMTDTLSSEHIRKVFSRAKCLFSSTEVEKALLGMASKIHHDLQDEDPVVLCVLIGGVVLTGKLLTLLDFPLQVDYIHATRYGDSTDNSTESKLAWVATPRVSLKGRTVLIVDDILDRGVTLAGIADYCRSQGAAEIKTAVLVEKEVSRPIDAVQKADYTGVVVENRYVFGYGMDYKGYLRNAPGIFSVALEDQ